MIVSYGVGPHIVNSEYGTSLHIDRVPSAFNLRLIHQALRLAGDPTGHRTLRVDLGEGIAVIHLAKDTETGGFCVENDEVVTEPITVDLIHGGT